MNVRQNYDNYLILLHSETTQNLSETIQFKNKYVSLQSNNIICIV